MKVSSFSWHLGWLLLCAVALSPLAFAYMGFTSAPEAPSAEEVRLAAAADTTQRAVGPELPIWMLLIVIAFTAAQLYAILRAARLSRKSILNPADLRQISFLCETPMYLGLLGSLVGVCMTQFVSGSLSAPLAYLTTIVGIMLYLYARFTVLLQLQMPDRLANDLTAQ